MYALRQRQPKSKSASDRRRRQTDVKGKATNGEVDATIGSARERISEIVLSYIARRIIGWHDAISVTRQSFHHNS